MLREKISKTLKVLGYTAFGILLFSVAGLVAINAPQFHGDYIRSNVGKSVVMITIGNSGGTGFHVEAPSGETYILTNRHICSGSKDGYVTVSNTTHRPIPRRIIEQYEHHDLCLVEALPSVPGLKVSNKAPRIGQIVGIVGHPRLHALTFMRGEVIDNPMIQLVMAVNIKEEECRGRFVRIYSYEQIENGIIVPEIFDIPRNVCIESFSTNQVTYIAYPGNSGSPTVDFFGNVVGVHFAGRRDSNTHGFTVPLEDIRAFLEVY